MMWLCLYGEQQSSAIYLFGGLGSLTCVTLADLELAMQTKLASNSQRSLCLCLPSSGVKGCSPKLCFSFSLRGRAESLGTDHPAPNVELLPCLAPGESDRMSPWVWRMPQHCSPVQLNTPWEAREGEKTVFPHSLQLNLPHADHTLQWSSLERSCNGGFSIWFLRRSQKGKELWGGERERASPPNF